MTQDQIASIEGIVNVKGGLKTVKCPHNSKVAVSLVGEDDQQKLIACPALSAWRSSGDRSQCLHLYHCGKGCPFVLDGKVIA